MAESATILRQRSTRVENRLRCFVCLEEENIYKFCKCNYAHQECLKEYLVKSGEKGCQVCKTPYNVIRRGINKKDYLFLLVKILVLLFLALFLMFLQFFGTIGITKEGIDYSMQDEKLLFFVLFLSVAMIPVFYAKANILCDRNLFSKELIENLIPITRTSRIDRIIIVLCILHTAILLIQLLIHLTGLVTLFVLGLIVELPFDGEVYKYQLTSLSFLYGSLIIFILILLVPSIRIIWKSAKHDLTMGKKNIIILPKE